MDQATAKKLIENTDYLDNQILAIKEKSDTIYGKITWKGYTAAFKDEEGEIGTVRVRIKNLHSGIEFSESLSKFATLFPKEFIENRTSSKEEILNVLNENENVQSKTLSWIEDSVTIPEAKNKNEIETLLTELWLESKVTKARMRTSKDTVYSLRVKK